MDSALPMFLHIHYLTCTIYYFNKTVPAPLFNYFTFQLLQLPVRAGTLLAQGYGDSIARLAHSMRNIHIQYHITALRRESVHCCRLKLNIIVTLHRRDCAIGEYCCYHHNIQEEWNDSLSHRSARGAWSPTVLQFCFDVGSFHFFRLCYLIQIFLKVGEADFLGPVCKKVRTVSYVSCKFWFKKLVS